MAHDFGRYFTRSEFSCGCGCGGCDVSQRLINKLNTVRELLKKPIVINSGFRCEEHNKKIGGSPTSSHLKGLAIDIFIPDSNYRFEFLKVILFLGGFKRIGIAKNFIHIDIDDEKPSDIIYLY